MRARPNYLRERDKNAQKNKRLAEGRGASHGRFPKEKRRIYTEFTRPDPAPIANYFVACGGSSAVDHRGVARSSPANDNLPSPLGFAQAALPKPRACNHLSTFTLSKAGIASTLRPSSWRSPCSWRLAEQRGKSVHRSAVLCRPSQREFSRRAQKISPAQAGPSQREETPPVQGQFQDIRVGRACYGQLKLAPSCDFWDTVLKRPYVQLP